MITADHTKQHEEAQDDAKLLRIALKNMKDAVKRVPGISPDAARTLDHMFNDLAEVDEDIAG